MHCMNNTCINVPSKQLELYFPIKSIIIPQSGFMINAPAKSASSHLISVLKLRQNTDKRDKQLIRF